MTSADLHHHGAGLAQAVFPRVPRGAALLGWSLGGMVALELAQRHPRHLRALVLVSTTTKFLSAPDWEHGMPAEVLEQFSLGLAADSRGEPDPATLEAGLGILRRADLRDALPGIALPALVIAGGRDRLTPPGAGRALAAGLPTARFVRLERCGHAPFLSHPDEVLAEVIGFLARHLGEATA